ncbi:hypothetical protein SRB5_68430 [Streptomyces sp. RB5]|uniref:Uncharacterized protein n=1 Tax=Streptomyces smaragdinus TaxID=2585196 RepID=A0A7K0CT59_9ACTN|nr:hypothetical protein [Streptomyces smaragdinus]
MSSSTTTRSFPSSARSCAARRRFPRERTRNTPAPMRPSSTTAVTIDPTGAPPPPHDVGARPAASRSAWPVKSWSWAGASPGFAARTVARRLSTDRGDITRASACAPKASPSCTAYTPAIPTRVRSSRNTVDSAKSPFAGRTATNTGLPASRIRSASAVCAGRESWDRTPGCTYTGPSRSAAATSATGSAGVCAGAGAAVSPRTARTSRRTSRRLMRAGPSCTPGRAAAAGRTPAPTPSASGPRPRRATARSRPAAHPSARPR